MSLAIIVHKEVNGVDGGALGAAENTFYTHKLTDMLINENNVTVLAFRNSSSGINPNQFDLSPGTYRITADIVFCNYNNSGTIACGTRAGLYNVTTGDFEYYFGSTTEKILSTSSLITSTSSGSFPETNGLTRFDALFSVSASVKSYEIRMAIQNSGAYPPTANDVLGDKSTITTSTPDEYYTIIKLLKMS